ncbi:glucose-1-phosphate adenylyltransferase subunit GlgD [Peptococcaceae bacterium 1198_IL3148]
MKDVMGIININENEDRLLGITRHRPVATIPFGGRYRIIDFTLSNMVNSGIRNIGILTHNKHRSLFDHLRSGKEWDLNRKRDGLFIFPPDNLQYPMDVFKGVLQYFYNNLNYINKSRQKYVLISGSNVICNIDLTAAFNYHKETKADITAIYSESGFTSHNLKDSTIINTLDNGRILDMEVNPTKIKSNRVALGLYILEKALLVDLIDACVSRGYYDLIKDGFIKNISMLNIYGYPHHGYTAKINSLVNYYRHSMDLLNPDIWQELFFKPGLIYTKVKDETPARYKRNSNVNNSIIANGCIIEGTVINSILFRGVKVHKGAVVKDSIIMQMSEIERNALVEYVITDKEVLITSGKQIRGDQNFPFLIEKKIVV